MFVYHIFMTSPLTPLYWLLVLSLYKEDLFYKFLNVCPFDYTAVAVTGKLERS